jgi:hypothetical protein
MHRLQFRLGAVADRHPRRDLQGSSDVRKKMGVPIRSHSFDKTKYTEQFKDRGYGNDRNRSTATERAFGVKV